MLTSNNACPTHLRVAAWCSMGTITESECAGASAAATQVNGAEASFDSTDV